MALAMNAARGVMEISSEFPQQTGVPYTDAYQALIARKHSPGRNYLDLGYT